MPALLFPPEEAQEGLSQPPGGPAHHQRPQTPHPLLPAQPVLLQQRQQLFLLVQQPQPLPEPEPELLQPPDEPQPQLEQQQCGGQEPQQELGPQEQPQPEPEL